MITDMTEMDFPLCDVCTEMVIADLNRRLEEVKSETHQYEQFEKQLDEEEARVATMDFSALHAEIKKVLFS